MGGVPLFFEIKGNSLDDGPGIRTVVFFKGCPMNCVWCHNPEGRRPGPEIAFDGGACIACGLCIKICTESALDRKLPGFVDRVRCTLCFDCVNTCPTGALERVGHKRSVDEIVEFVKRDLPFFKRSGGGVTLSGGEPTMFPDFAGELAAALGDMGIHVLLETCGLLDMDRFREHLYPHLDLIYVDLKIVDLDAHKRYCRTSNEKILSNLAMLHRLSENGGAEVLVRVPLVPGITATDRNLASIAAFLGDAGIGRVSLLSYNPMWGPKLVKLGEQLPELAGIDLERFMSAEELDRCRSQFRGFELL